MPTSRRSPHPVGGALHAGRRQGPRPGVDRDPRRLSVHARGLLDRLPRTPLDHAPVRRLRLRRRHERALPLPDVAGAERPLVAFDMPTLMGRDADDPMSIGEVGRCGAAVSSLRDMETPLQRDPARRGVGLDDDLGSGGDALLLLPRGRRAAGCAFREADGHVPDRHPQGVHRAEGVGVSTASSPAN